MSSSVAITKIESLKFHPDQGLLQAAMPQLEVLRGKNIVVKFGGELVEQHGLMRSLAHDLVALRAVGVNIVVCHGGGPQINRNLSERGIRPVFHRGQRVTDDETVKSVCRILRGEINTSLVTAFNGVAPVAVGLSGLDGALFRVRQSDPELGWVGTIEEVNRALIESLTTSGYVPVIASLGIDERGQIYNINADMAASSLASTLQAERFFLFTNVEGLYRSLEDKQSLLTEVTVVQLKALLPSLSSGMIPKVEALIHSIEHGARSANIVDGRGDHALLKCFTLAGPHGTYVREN